MNIKNAIGKRKGAIELSLGFIVTVVFAVVLLSLAIVWLRGMFANIDVVANDMTRQAQEEISKTFSETTSNFAVRPARPEVTRGTKLIVQAGVKNNDPSGKTLNFVINVKPGNTNTKITKEELGIWITQTTETYAGPNEVAYRDVIIKVPQTAETGSYMFDVFACASETPGMDPSTCDTTSTNKWGVPQTLTVNVKST
jgi:cytoskeletal protein RodZ